MAQTDLSDWSYEVDVCNKECLFSGTLNRVSWRSLCCFYVTQRSEKLRRFKGLEGIIIQFLEQIVQNTEKNSQYLSVRRSCNLIS